MVVKNILDGKELSSSVDLEFIAQSHESAGEFSSVVKGTPTRRNLKVIGTLCGYLCLFGPFGVVGLLKCE